MLYRFVIPIFYTYLFTYRIENQCEVVMAVVPLTRLEKALNQFDDEGYEPGVVSNNQEQKGIHTHTHTHCARA